MSHGLQSYRRCRSVLRDFENRVEVSDLEVSSEARSGDFAEEASGELPAAELQHTHDKPDNPGNPGREYDWCQAPGNDPGRTVDSEHAT